MARTLTQIEQTLARSIALQDSSIDTVKGPVFDIYIRPQATQSRFIELLYDDLSRRYSLDYVQSRDPTSVQLYGANHGLRRSGGKSASGNVTFFTYSPPDSGSTLTIPAGTVVATSDSRISFRTTQDAFIAGSSLSSFYNASTRRYEVRVPIIALGSGDVFEVPPTRIKNISSALPGIDGVTNTERVTNSVEAESLDHFGTRIRSKFNGLALGSGDGLASLIRQFDTDNISDLAMVYSTDPLFRRRTRRSAWDVYLIGTLPETSSTVFVGNGVTRSFQLPLAPVLAVSSVKVGSAPVGFTLVPDSTDQLSTSSRAVDVVELASTPGVNEVITVSYSYDKLIRDVQDYVDSIGVQLYRADILVRKAIPVPIRSRVRVQVLSSFDATEAASSAFSTVSEFSSQSNYVSLLFADKLRENLSSAVAGVSNVSIVEFTRDLTGTIPVETVEFAANEYPETPDSLITVDIVQ